MKGGRRTLLIVGVLFIACAGAGTAFFAATRPAEMETTTATLNDIPLVVTIAKTPSALRRGLSDTEELPSNAGMLLVFPTKNDAGIWMRDMLFPIDILWLDENLTVTTIAENVTPKTYPTIFYPTVPARFVLEVNAGWAQAQKITTGMTVVLTGNEPAGLY